MNVHKIHLETKGIGERTDHVCVRERERAGNSGRRDASDDKTNAKMCSEQLGDMRNGSSCRFIRMPNSAFFCSNIQNHRAFENCACLQWYWLCRHVLIQCICNTNIHTCILAKPQQTAILSASHPPSSSLHLSL